MTMSTANVNTVETEVTSAEQTESPRRVSDDRCVSATVKQSEAHGDLGATLQPGGELDDGFERRISSILDSLVQDSEAERPSSSASSPLTG
jgi:hypothetical protein